MLRKIIFGIVVGIIVFGGIYWFIYTKEARTPISDGINAIPTDAAIIFESKQAKNTWKKLSQTNIMWEDLLGTESVSQINKQGQYIDSLISANQDISELLDNHSVFISAHVSETKSYDLLYVYSLPNLTYKSTLENFIKTINDNKKFPSNEFEGTSISTIQPKGKNPLFFTFLNGTLIMSAKQTLVETSIANDKNFSKIINSAGKNVDGNIYLNYKKFPNLIDNFIFPTVKKDNSSLSNFADYSGWDITIKPNVLELNGFTLSNDSSANFLSLFSKQKPQSIELTKIIPSKTATMLFFGMSNIKSFHEDYKKYLSAKQHTKEPEEYINKINNKYHLDIETTMLSWMDNEMALVITEPTSTDFTNNSFAVIHSNNIDNAVQTLNDLSKSVNVEEKTDTVNYKSHVINHLNLPQLLPQLLGWQFNKVTENYFTNIDNYIVFANTADALKDFIDDFESNKTLANDKNYKAFSENISAETNVYLYSSIARSANIYSSFVTEELAKEFELKTELFKKFEAIGIQFTSNNQLFYSNIYLKYNPIHNQESGTIWEAKLDTTISSKPYLLINHNTKAKEVFVQDDANKIYLISNTGKIIWTKQLHEKIMSDVSQLDVLKNNKLQLIFNTRSFIYMYDRNGNEMKGFPIKLRSPATNAISIVDYDKNREYRIFIATENKRIVCYKANGEQLTAFAFDKTDDQVYLPLQYFNANNKDHLIAIDVKGKIYIIDRQGEIRVKMQEQMAQGIRNFFVEPGKDYAKSYIVAADTLGNIIKVSLTSEKESIKMQDFETSPYFDYKDINNDKTKEYIFLSRNELKVFSQDKSLLFKYDFEEKISQIPLFFLFPDGTGKIGVAAEESNKIYLFNNNGSLFNTFPLTGKTNFSLGDLNNEGIINLVTGSSENSIYLYQIQ
jgi:hypothetical protein